MRKRNINRTQLYISMAEKRGIIHRDYIAHCLRWSHVIKYAKINKSWLDIGCGDFPLLMTLYTNRYKPKRYTGVDVRDLNDKLPKVNFKAEFIQGDVVDILFNINNKYDYIVCFEVLEHVEENHAKMILKKIAKIADKGTNIFISTPNYDAVHQAKNHIKEWTYGELKSELRKYFIIENVYGTFSSQKDIKNILSKDEQNVFNNLQDYYDSNFLSIIFAPMHPKESRNCLWRLKKK